MSKQVFLYSTDNKIGEAVKVSPSFLAISSKVLNLPVRDLRIFMKRVKLLDRDRLTRLTYEERVKHDYKECVIFESDKIVKAGLELDWKIICTMYTLANGSDPDKDYRNVMKYIQERELAEIVYQDELDRHHRALITLHKELDRSYSFFSAEMLAKACKRIKLKVQVDGGLCIVSNRQPIKLGDVTYNDITLYIMDWQIKKFMIGFPEFDYYSDDHRSIVLHPNIHTRALPYGSKGELVYCTGYYDQFAQTLANIMIEYKDVGDASVFTSCHKTFEGLLRLWNDLHYSIKDRRELSQRILKYYLK